MKKEAYYLIKKGKADQAFEKKSIQLETPKAGEVQIEVEAFGLNYADVMARNGLYREAPEFPFVAGYEVVGKVTAIGSEENKHLLNKRVVAFTRFGGYSQLVNTSANGVAIIDDADAGEALALATQYVTAYYMTHYCNGVLEGDKILIHACAGGVGTALTQLAKLRGATIYGTASQPEKMTYAKEQGVDVVINYREKDYLTELQKTLGTERLDATFNPIAGSTFKKDFSLIGSGGKLFLFGGSERSGKSFGIFSTLNFVFKMGRIIPIGLMMRSKSIIGVNMLKIADNNTRIIKHCLNEVVQLWQDKKIKPMVGHQFNAKDLPQAHQLLEDRKSMGKIIVFWESTT